MASISLTARSGRSSEMRPDISSGDQCSSRMSLTASERLSGSSMSLGRLQPPPVCLPLCRRRAAAAPCRALPAVPPDLAGYGRPVPVELPRYLADPLMALPADHDVLALRNAKMAAAVHGASNDACLRKHHHRSRLGGHLAISCCTRSEDSPAKNKRYAGRAAAARCRLLPSGQPTQTPEEPTFCPITPEYSTGGAKREQRARHVLAHSPQNCTGRRPIEESDADLC